MRLFTTTIGALALVASMHATTAAQAQQPTPHHMMGMMMNPNVMMNPATMMNPMLMGMNPGMMQQPIQPPSDAEIQLALMRSVAPIDRFVAGAQMAVMVQMLNDLVSFSVLEIMKNATFVINEADGTMKMDVSSLPSNLQTMSAENVTNQFNQLQSASQQNIQQMGLTRRYHDERFTSRFSTCDYFTRRDKSSRRGSCLGD